MRGAKDTLRAPSITRLRSIKTSKQLSSQKKMSLESLKQGNKTTLRQRVLNSFRLRPLSVTKKSLYSLFKNKNSTKKQGFNNPSVKKQIDQVSYLNTICSDSGECLVFGRENQGIKGLFDGFADFKYLTDVRKVGERSSNGFVLNLQYERMNYKVNTLLKSARAKYSDNLYYEYLVGTKFINRVNLFFPCFTETYHLFKHKSASSKELIENNDMDIAEFSNLIDMNICDEKRIKNSLTCIKNSCQEGYNFAILLQYIDEPISFDSFVKKHDKDKFFRALMMGILVQIYAPLSYLKEDFTHYDLHLKNVLLYKLPKGKFVEIKYKDERDSSIITIQTNYIVKIIDYGRCYFGNLGNDKYMTSNSLVKLIKGTKECTDKGLRNVGYNFLDDPVKGNFYISSTQKNTSHDLRFVHLLSEKSNIAFSEIGGLIEYEGFYGTPQNVSHKNRDYYIRDVGDMYVFLQKYFEDPIQFVEKGDESIGCIEVYMTNKLCEKEMKFFPSN
jgi:hypothetical protein